MKPFLLTLFLFITSIVLASELNIDQQVKVLKGKFSFSEKLDAIDEIIEIEDFESNVDFTRAAYELLKECNAESRTFEANKVKLAIALNWSRAGEFQKSMDWAVQINSYFLDNNHPKLATVQYSREAINLIQQGENHKALLKIKELRGINEERDWKIDLNQLIYLEARICFNLGEYNESISKIEKYLEKGKGQMSLSNQARAYALLGNVYQAQDKLSRATEYYNKGAECALRDGKLALLAEAQTNLGIVEYIQGNEMACLDLFEKALANQKKLGNPKLITETLYNLGVFHFDSGRFSEAEVYFMEGMSFSEDHNLLSDRLDFLTELANMNIQKGNYEVSNEYLKEFIDIQSKLHAESISSQEVYSEELSESKLSNIMQLHAVEMDRIQEQKKKLMIGFAVSGLLVVALVFMYMRKKKASMNNDPLNLNEAV